MLCVRVCVFGRDSGRVELWYRCYISTVTGKVELKPKDLQHTWPLKGSVNFAYAFDFCKEHSITPIVIDIPIIDFFNSGKAIKYAREYGCVSPQFTPILEAFNKVDGNIIYSGHQKIFTNCQLSLDVYKCTHLETFGGQGEVGGATFLRCFCFEEVY